VLECRNIEFACQRNCLVGTADINKEHFVNNIEGEPFVCLAQCPCGIVGRHDYHDFLFVKHVVISFDDLLSRRPKLGCPRPWREEPQPDVQKYLDRRSPFQSVMLILYCGNASDGEECRCHGVIDFEGNESRTVSQGEANWRFCPPMTRVTLDSRIDTQPTK
jgi:hypothetical protein